MKYLKVIIRSLFYFFEQPIPITVLRKVYAYFPPFTAMVLYLRQDPDAANI